MTQGAEEEPRWVRVYVDGGVLSAGRHSRQRRGVYWSALAEDSAAAKRAFPERRQSLQFTTNNDAEWLALREGLTIAVGNYAHLPIVIYSDSRLIVNCFNGVWRTKIARHHRWRDECRALAENCKFVVVQWVPRRVMVEKLGH